MGRSNRTCFSESWSCSHSVTCQRGCSPELDSLRLPYKAHNYSFMVDPQLGAGADNSGIWNPITSQVAHSNKIDQRSGSADNVAEYKSCTVVSYEHTSENKYFPGILERLISDILWGFRTGFVLLTGSADTKKAEANKASASRSIWL